MPYHLSQLGKKSSYPQGYNKNLLLGIERKPKRLEIGIDDTAMMYGFDAWKCYEVSWLGQTGKPEARIISIIYDASSVCLVESKSLKLYLNSFNNERYDSEDEIVDLISRDLAEVLGTQPQVDFVKLTNIYNITYPSGIPLDDINIDMNDTENVRPDFLATDNNNLIHESIFSDLLKSNCLVTNQPDWGTIVIEYEGKKICHEGLLKYIISFRNHNEFHEQCIERIFMDIMCQCSPKKLTVYARYTRRGGIDINPYRSTEKSCLDMANKSKFKDLRFIRQ